MNIGNEQASHHITYLRWEPKIEYVFHRLFPCPIKSLGTRLRDVVTSAGGIIMFICRAGAVILQHAVVLIILSILCA